MAVTTEEAVRFLTDAGVSVHASAESTLLLPRVEICRTLIALCHDHDPHLPPLRWNTPVSDLYYHGPVDVDEYVEMVVETFSLDYQDGHGVDTFGDLVLYVEERLREFRHADAARGCPSQVVFYELRRAIKAGQNNVTVVPQLRPSTRLRDCLPPERSDTVIEFLRQRFGIEEEPVSLRILGRMEFGATWLALWFLTVLYGCITFGDMGLHPAWFFAGFVGSAVLIALLLRLVSRPVWENVRTLGDLTRWTLKENGKAVDRIRHAIQRWN